MPRKGKKKEVKERIHMSGAKYYENHVESILNVIQIFLTQLEHERQQPAWSVFFITSK